MGIKYKEGYKYQLADGYVFYGDIRPIVPIEMDFLSLDTDGKLTIKKGYAWDGPSGPTYDFKCFMRGALIHDAYYQLLESRRISIANRERADRILRDVCLNDGMAGWYASAVYHAVRMFGDGYCKTERKILTAP